MMLTELDKGRIERLENDHFDVYVRNSGAKVPIFPALEKAKDYFNTDVHSIEGFTSDDDFVGPDNHAYYMIGEQGNIVLVPK